MADRHSMHCSRCGKSNDRPKQSYCRACHAAYMREHRPAHSELSAQERLKSNARAYANVYQTRGKLVRKPCSECGFAKAEKHHNDYRKPLQVQWVCRPCHLRLHAIDHAKFTPRRDDQGASVPKTYSLPGHHEE